MKAVIPAAGMGTRILPATKSMPKEMLPVVDKPVIQYVVEEAVASGIDDILIVTGRGKRAIEDHFDRSVELELHLESKGQDDAAKRVRAISDMATIHYVRQPDPLGLGHAVLMAQRFVGNEPFAVLLGDDIVLDRVPATRQLMDVHKVTGKSVLSVMNVPDDEVHKYGIAVPSDSPKPVPGCPDVSQILGLMEKPQLRDAPSRSASIGRYVLTPAIFEQLHSVKRGHGGEIQLADAIHQLAGIDTVHAATFRGTRLDVGSIAGFIAANIRLAFDDAQLRNEILRQVGTSQDLTSIAIPATANRPPP